MLVGSQVATRPFIPATTETVESPSAPLSALAAEALLASGGDTSAAAKVLLRELLLKHPEYYAWRADLAMSAWAKDQIRSARTECRSRIEMSASTPTRDGTLSASTVQSLALAYMHWPVYGRVLLKDATKGEIDMAVQKYRNDASTYQRRAKWLSAVAAKLPDDDTRVSDVLDEAAVARLAARFKV